MKTTGANDLKEAVLYIRRIKLLERKLKLATAIIRNEAYAAEFYRPKKSSNLKRWADELEREAGLK